MSLARALRPDAAPGWLRRARVPLALCEAQGLAADAEGLASVDIRIAEGRIAEIAKPQPGEGVDLRGGQVWPAFVDMHTHLDKGHIWPRAANADGTHATAASTVAQDRKANWTHEDVTRRFSFALQSAYAHGTAALRTHIDSYEVEQARTSWSVFAEQRQAWAGRLVLQGVSMARLDTYLTLDGEALAALVAEHGGALGGIIKVGRTVREQTPEHVGQALDHLFGLATAHSLDVDLHVDETADPSQNGLQQVAQAVLRSGFAGKVACGHCCNLATRPDCEADQTIAQVREAAITVVTLPMVNQYLQGRRPGRTPHWRGITRVVELAEAGIKVVAASDNCRDPFFAFGDLDALEVFRELARIGQLDLDWPNWFGAVTARPAQAMRLDTLGRIALGLPADLVLFEGRTMTELLSRPQSDRVVLRAGVAIDTTLPDYRSLDPEPIRQPI